MFLVSSSVNASIFHVTWLDTFWTDLTYPMTNTFVSLFCAFTDYYSILLICNIFSYTKSINLSLCQTFFPVIHIIFNLGGGLENFFVVIQL